MVIARALALALREAGHQADLVVTPDYGFGRQASAYLATWLTDVGTRAGHQIDQVISLRYPSYAVRHPRHVSWLNHTMREYYDLWERFCAGLSQRGRVKERLRRRVIHTADRYLLTRNVSKVFVQSRTIQNRLRIWPELKSTVLYPPAPPRAYRCDDYGNFVFMISRLTPLKRAELLIRALGTWDGSGIRAVIAGDGEERARLNALVLELGLGDRVALPGALTEPQLLDHLARCRAVCFPPLDEDYGFVTTEAFASGKAVITCRDSGGPAELVEDGVSGLVCDSTPDALARALRMVMDDRGRAEKMGAAARDAGAQLSWPETVRQLTGID
jgi:glycosyltransferase involved in cell wall biosynthesis